MIQTCPDMSEEGGVTEPKIAKVLEIVLDVFLALLAKTEKNSLITKFFITASDFGESTRR